MAEQETGAPAVPGVTRWRKKPIEITAIQFTGTNVNEIWDAFGAAGIYGPTEKNPDWLILTTVHGDEAPARAGDWIIPDAAPDTFYPCKPDVFARTYEPAEPSRAESPALVPASPAAMSTETLEPSPVAAALDREALGRMVHRVRLAHNAELERPFHLEPWEERSPGQRELDMATGEAVAAHAAAVVSLEMHRLAVKEIRAAEAERDRVRAKLAEVRALLEGTRLGAAPYVTPSLSVQRILAIIGTEGEAGHA